MVSLEVWERESTCTMRRETESIHRAQNAEFENKNFRFMLTFLGVLKTVFGELCHLPMGYIGPPS